MKVYAPYIILHLHLHLHPGNLRCAVWRRRLLLAGLMEHRSQWFTFQLMGRSSLKLTVCLLHKPYLITGLVQQALSSWLPTLG